MLYIIVWYIKCYKFTCTFRHLLFTRTHTFLTDTSSFVMVPISNYFQELSFLNNFNVQISVTLLINKNVQKCFLVHHIYGTNFRNYYNEILAPLPPNACI